MGWLAAQGAIMAIGLFIGLVCSVIGLFFGHIILFDSNADHEAQRRMNCSKLIAAHSGGDAESNAVKENDMPEE